MNNYTYTAVEAKHRPINHMVVWSVLKDILIESAYVIRKYKYKNKS